jgi:hypothetical protein
MVGAESVVLERLVYRSGSIADRLLPSNPPVAEISPDHDGCSLVMTQMTPPTGRFGCPANGFHRWLTMVTATVTENERTPLKAVARPHWATFNYAHTCKQQP